MSNSSVLIALVAEVRALKLEAGVRATCLICPEMMRTFLYSEKEPSKVAGQPIIITLAFSMILMMKKLP